MLISALLAKKGHDVVTIDGLSNLGKAVELMSKNNIGAIIVVDRHGELTGLLAEREIITALAARAAGVLEAPISNWMRRDVPTVMPETSVKDAMAIVTTARTRHLPVIDHGRIVGVLSVGDLLKSRLEEKTQENLVLMDVARWPPASVA